MPLFLRLYTGAIIAASVCIRRPGMCSAHTFVGGVSSPNFQFLSERNPRFVIESLDDNDGDSTRVKSQAYRAPRGMWSARPSSTPDIRLRSHSPEAVRCTGYDDCRCIKACEVLEDVVLESVQHAAAPIGSEKDGQAAIGVISCYHCQRCRRRRRRHASDVKIY